MNNTVLVQYKIEMQTKDLDDIHYRAYSSNTRFTKVFKEITFLTNVAFHDFEEMGLILGNNVNAIKYNGMENVNLLKTYDNEDDDEAEEGYINPVQHDLDFRFEGAINLVAYESNFIIKNSFNCWDILMGQSAAN